MILLDSLNQRSYNDYMEYEIIFRSKLTVGMTQAYAETLEAARALAMHHLSAGRYDYAAVYGPEGGQAKFRARRWFSPHFAAVIDTPQTEPRRRVPEGVNAHEYAARVAKARKLSDALLRHGISYSDALLMDEAMWRLAAVAAGVKPPSSTTVMLTLENMAWVAGVAA